MPPRRKRTRTTSSSKSLSSSKAQEHLERAAQEDIEIAKIEKAEETKDVVEEDIGSTKRLKTATDDDLEATNGAIPTHDTSAQSIDMSMEPREDPKSKGLSTLWLDTVHRPLLDFDFEKLCSVSLTHNNVYGCLVCGKYFQGGTIYSISQLSR
jgi:U4/U6.U5 tri-snRNP-associated protein 2